MRGDGPVVAPGARDVGGEGLRIRAAYMFGCFSFVVFVFSFKSIMTCACRYVRTTYKYTYHMHV